MKPLLNRLTRHLEKAKKALEGKDENEFWASLEDLRRALDQALGDD